MDLFTRQAPKRVWCVAWEVVVTSLSGESGFAPIPAKASECVQSVPSSLLIPFLNGQHGPCAPRPRPRTRRPRRAAHTSPSYSPSFLVPFVHDTSSTMSFNNPVDLPKIPSLPPIEMPDTSSFLGSSSSTEEDQDSLSPLRPSGLSAESYLTANTSFSVNSSGSTELSSTPAQLLAPPTNLRKSISVDSFIKYRHLSGSSTRPNRGNTTASVLHPPPQVAQPVPREPSPAGLRREQPHPTVAAAPWKESLQSRARGTSTSTLGDEAYLDDSDVERSEDLRRDVAKRMSMARHTVREGELTLPSRIPPSPGRTPEPIVPARSSSLSHRKVKQKVPMSVNTRISVSIFVLMYLHAKLISSLCSPPARIPKWLSPSSEPLVVAGLRSFARASSSMLSGR